MANEVWPSTGDKWEIATPYGLAMTIKCFKVRNLGGPEDGIVKSFIFIELIFLIYVVIRKLPFEKSLGPLEGWKERDLRVSGKVFKFLVECPESRAAFKGRLKNHSINQTWNGYSLFSGHHS